MFGSSDNAFRPRFESLEARDQPAGLWSFHDLLVTSYQAPPPEMGEGDQIEVQGFSWGVTQTGTLVK